MSKRSYTLENLLKHCRDYNIKNMSYTNSSVCNETRTSKSGPKPRGINRDTMIEGDCIETGCSKQFKKTYRDLVEKNGLCRTHCVEHANKKREETCLSIHGYVNVNKSEDVKNKSKITSRERYGTDHPLQSEKVRDKGKETMLKNMGVENPSQSKDIIELKKQNRLSKGEIKYTSAFLNELIEKDNGKLNSEYDDLTLQRETDIVFTCNCGNEHTKKFRVIQKYGAFCNNCQEIHEKEKTKETNIKNRGVPFTMQDPSVRKKVETTNLERYGGHPIQTDEYFEKCQKNQKKRKPYTFPSGRIDSVQGDEPYALELLLQNNIPEDDIMTKRFPDKFMYKKEDKIHRYYPDIYIRSQKKYIEVKSDYRYECDKTTVLLKQQAVKDAGYECEIWIFNKIKQRIEIKP